MAFNLKTKGYSVASLKIFAIALTTVTLITSFAAAADLNGRVINGTTRTAAIGDEVVLLGLSNDGMNEIARTRTDRAGRFGLRVNDPQATHVVRVVHEGVTYHQVVPPDVNNVSIEAYDVTANADGISAVMDVERFESIGDQLEVKQLVTMRNESKPPRTLMKDRSFEIQLLPEAKVKYGLVQVEDAQALKQKPIAGDVPGQYYFVFPIRPGDTRFAVVYQVPYTGEATIRPTIRDARERFVAMLPKSMKFEPIDPRVYQPMENTTPDNVQTTEPVAPDQTVSFHISGTGTLAELEGRRQTANESRSSHVSPRSSTPTPGGGLGVPIGAPDPLERYRWRIIGGLAIALFAGAVLVVARGQTAWGANPDQKYSHNPPAPGIRSQGKRGAGAPRTRYRGRSIAKASR
jgi:hypothetical protein